MPVRRLRRWATLRRASALTPSSREGAFVHATGIARALADPYIAPLTGIRSVVVRTTYRAGGAARNGTQATTAPMPSRVEELLIAPFVLETERMRIVVDGSHVVLLVPPRKDHDLHRQHSFLARHGLQRTWGSFGETLVAEGAQVTVVGTLLRDGGELPAGDLAFREAQHTYKLVGGKARPIVITQ